MWPQSSHSARNLEIDPKEFEGIPPSNGFVLEHFPRPTQWRFPRDPANDVRPWESYMWWMWYHTIIYVFTCWYPLNSSSNQWIPRPSMGQAATSLRPMTVLLIEASPNTPNINGVSCWSYAAMRDPVCLEETLELPTNAIDLQSKLLDWLLPQDLFF